MLNSFNALIAQLLLMGIFAVFVASLQYTHHRLEPHMAPTLPYYAPILPPHMVPHGA